jgi:hypothetical protein
MSLESRTRLFIAHSQESRAYLYPKADIERALQLTPFPFRREGNNIICPSLNDINEVYYAIWYQTSLSQPVEGFSCDNGTLFEDLGEKLFFILESGEIVVKWQLVKQITPQVNPPLPAPRSSPNGTVGFITVFSNKYPSTGNIDPPSVIRVG